MYTKSTLWANSQIFNYKLTVEWNITTAIIKDVTVNVTVAVATSDVAWRGWCCAPPTISYSLVSCSTCCGNWKIIKSTQHMQLLQSLIWSCIHKISSTIANNISKLMFGQSTMIINSVHNIIVVHNLNLPQRVRASEQQSPLTWQETLQEQ